MIYKDDRGEIIDVCEGDIKALQVITSKKGSVRSNHYHVRGGHWLYVLSGEMRYVERAVDSKDITERIIKQGETVFTGPLKIHATEFLEDTVLVCASTVKRSETAYDDDLVRVRLI